MIFFELYNAHKFPNAEWEKGMDFIDTIYCPVNDGHQRAGKRAEHLIINLPSSRIGDFIWTWYSECVLPERTAELLKKEGFTGFKLNLVTVAKVFKHHTTKDIIVRNGKIYGTRIITRDRNPRPVPPLFELVITGKGGDAHPDSGIYLKYECPACGLKKYSAHEKGIIVDKKNWDGSDFFVVNGYQKDILVTEKVKKFIDKENFSNVSTIESHLLKWPEGVIKP